MAARTAMPAMAVAEFTVIAVAMRQVGECSGALQAALPPVQDSNDLQRGLPLSTKGVAMPGVH
jgi:hypothetical protein